MLIVLQVGYFSMRFVYANRESGTFRPKNIAVLFILVAVTFWLLGFAFAFGRSASGIIGFSNFFPNFIFDPLSTQAQFFLFELLLALLVTTLIICALPGKFAFTRMLGLILLVAVVIYPAMVHWAWNGRPGDEATGWLGQIGFIDFAGSSVIFSLAAWVALAVLLIPYFRENQPKGLILGSDEVGEKSFRPIFSLLAIFIGIMGLVGGTQLITAPINPQIFLNTLIATLFGIIWSVIADWIKYNKPSWNSLLIGGMAGMIAILAGVNLFPINIAAFVGAFAGLLTTLSFQLLRRYQLTPAFGFVALNLIAGSWGTLAVGFFSPFLPDALGTSIQQQIGVQLVGISISGLWAFGLTWVILLLLNLIKPVMPSTAVERETQTDKGSLDRRTEREFRSFSRIIEIQANSNDKAFRVPIDQFSILSPTITNYNKVLDRYQSESHLFRTAIESSSDGFILFSEATMIVSYFNQAGMALFGLPADFSFDKTIAHFLILDVVDNLSELFTSIAASAKPYEFIGVTVTGSEFPLEMSLSKCLTRDDEKVYIGTFRPITERIKRQNALKSEIRELQYNNQFKDQFLAAMRHELRTPLNSILGMAEAINSEIYGSINEQQEIASKNILTSGRQLLGLIDEILDLSNIAAGNGKPDFMPVNIAKLCANVIEGIEGQASEKELTIITRYDDRVEYISADPNRIQQILNALLQNAIKFTDRHGKIGLMTVGSPDEKLMHFIVWDTGIGIKQEDIKVIFKPFVQADGSFSRQFSGAGLGLAIVKRLVDLHAGSIRVSSDIGKGSRFIVSLPWTSNHQSDSTETGDGEPNITTIDETVIATIAEIESAEYVKTKILIAEDNEANLKTLSDYLELHGYEIVVARNGIDAINQVELSNPAMVLMDIQMPKMDGLTATRQLRKKYDKTVLPIIALTAFAMPGDREKCLAAGANQYISKPISLKHLLVTIQQNLKDSAEKTD